MIKKRIALWLLEVAERFFLRANGWEESSKRFTYHENDMWIPRIGYPYRKNTNTTSVYHRRHAVNSQVLESYKMKKDKWRTNPK